MEVLRTGDIVEIKGAYFKSDNGLWFIRRAPGDADWSGSECSLLRLCKDGKISRRANNRTFWPLICFVNDRDKKAEAKAWNERNATIRVRTDIESKYVADYFREEADKADKTFRYFKMHYEFGEYASQKKALADFFSRVAERIEMESKAKDIKNVSPTRQINPMCKGCSNLFKDCQGSTEMVWTGCVYRNKKI